MKRSITTLILVLGLALVASAVLADVPHTISYQGRLTDADGRPVDSGQYDMRFSIYDSPSAGVELWSSGDVVEVTVVDGLFNYLLGSGNQIPATLAGYDSLWLGISVDPDPEIDPRTRLVSSLYAFKALVAESAYDCDSATHADTADFAYAVADNSVGGGQVIDGSLFSADLGNEPGVAYHYNQGGSGQIEDDKIAVLMVDTIHCPTDGYVVVHGDFVAGVDHVEGSSDNQYVYGLGLDSTAISVAEFQWYFPDDLASGMYNTHLSVDRVVAVSAGQNVFYLLAREGEAPGHEMYWSHPNLILLFVPTSYAN